MSPRFRHPWRDWLRPPLGVAIVFGSFRSACADWNDHGYRPHWQHLFTLLS